MGVGGKPWRRTRSCVCRTLDGPFRAQLGEQRDQAHSPFQWMDEEEEMAQPHVLSGPPQGLPGAQCDTDT